jgi:hypothetical protein
VLPLLSTFKFTGTVALFAVAYLSTSTVAVIAVHTVSESASAFAIGALFKKVASAFAIITVHFVSFLGCTYEQRFHLALVRVPQQLLSIPHLVKLALLDV